MSELDRLGARRRKALAELDEIDPALRAAMRAERAKGMTLQEIADKSGYAFGTTRNITDDVKTPTKRGRPRKNRGDAPA